MKTRSALAGASAAVSLIATASGVFAALCPTQSVLGPVARNLDAYGPWLFCAGVVFAVLTAVLGGRVAGAVLAMTALVAGAFLFASYRDVTAPTQSDLAAEIRVLFFNVLASNGASSEGIVAAALETKADIVVFAEAAGLAPALDRLRAAYGFVSPCPAGKCELLVASNLEVVRFWQMRLNPVWAERYAVLEVERPGGGTVFLAASHLAKPWMSGIAEAELAQLTAQYNWLTGPVIAVGDYNMPPWSLPMRQLLGETGLRGVRGQPATWPVPAGVFGLPIDQILVRGGVTVVRVLPFGEGLGSNHLGLLADIAILPPAAP